MKEEQSKCILKIRNVGPIVEAELNLNKVNVIMGEQSSGKSTINKISCFCNWVEKEICVIQSASRFQEDGVFSTELVRFHKLEGYLTDKTEINYESNAIKFSYSHSNKEFKFDWKDENIYKRKKLVYIPAERNIVATIPNWFEVKFMDNNILSFMKDWGEARDVYSKDKPFQILDIDAKYYHEDGIDYVIVDKGGKTLRLTNTSSGLQSLIPLMVIIDYITDWIYHKDVPQSIESKRNKKRLHDTLFKKHVIDVLKEDFDYKLKDETSVLFNNSSGSVIVLDKFIELFQSITEFKGTNIFLEEPEQNLFPSAQRNLIYHLLQIVNNEEKEHSLLLTTHSPYVLYALNNCMMGYLVKDVISEEDSNEVSCKNAWINPNDVSVYEIKDGRLVNIQKEDGLIGNNYFDTYMGGIMDDFYKMLNYYGDDKE